MKIVEIPADFPQAAGISWVSVVPLLVNIGTGGPGAVRAQTRSRQRRSFSPRSGLPVSGRSSCP